MDDERPKIRPRPGSDALKIAETHIRRKARELENQAVRSKKIKELKKKNRNLTHQKKVKTPQHFIKQYQQKNLERKRAKKLKKSAMAKPKDSNPHHLIVVVRNGKKAETSSIKETLKKLRIQKDYSCVFVSNTPETNRLLRLVKPYVFFGYPTYNVVNTLFFKRGQIRVNGKPELITNNRKLEELLGQYGIFCIQDLIHQIWENGTHKDTCLSHIAPFELTNLRKTDGLEAKLYEFGNMGEKIGDTLLKIV